MGLVLRGKLPLYDTLFVDEAQDLLADEISLLSEWSADPLPPSQSGVRNDLADKLVELLWPTLLARVRAEIRAEASGSQNKRRRPSGQSKLPL